MNNKIFLYTRDHRVNYHLDFFIERNFTINQEYNIFFQLDLDTKIIHGKYDVNFFKNYYNLDNLNVSDIERILDDYKIYKGCYDISQRILFEIPNDFELIEKYLENYGLNIFLPKRKIKKDINLIFC